MLVLENPAGRNATTEVFILDNEQATPSPTRFEFAQIQAEEGANAELRVDVIRSAGDLVAGTVRLRSVGGTALPGQHYWAIDSALEFEFGQTRASTILRLINDDTFTGDRTVNLLLDSPSEGLILDSPSSATVLIHDDDLPTVAPLARLDRVTPVWVRGKLKRLTVSFSGELDSTQTIDATAMVLVRAGHDGRIGTSDDRITRFGSVRIDAASNAVILTPPARVALRSGFHLRVVGDRIKDRQNRGLDADGDGVAGGIRWIPLTASEWQDSS